MEEVLMSVGARSTIITEATPIHISSKTLEDRVLESTMEQGETELQLLMEQQ